MTMIDNEWQMFLNAQQSNECSSDAMDLWKLTNNSSVYSSNNNDSLSEDDNDDNDDIDDDQSTSSSCTGKKQKNAKNTNIIHSEMKNKNKNN